jgi:hypothetical protein
MLGVADFDTAHCSDRLVAEPDSQHRKHRQYLGSRGRLGLAITTLTALTAVPSRARKIRLQPGRIQVLHHPCNNCSRYYVGQPSRFALPKLRARTVGLAIL